MQRKWVTHTVLVGMQNGTATLENSLAGLKRIKYTTIIQQVIAFWAFIPEK